jgi:excisionase family DNA binding protein
LKQLMRAREVADRLSVSPMTVRRWIATHRLRAVRLGRAVRVREEDVEALVRFGVEDHAQRHRLAPSSPRRGERG